MEGYEDYQAYLEALNNPNSSANRDLKFNPASYAYHSGSTLELPAAVTGKMSQSYHEAVDPQYAYNEAYPGDFFAHLPQFNPQDFSDVSAISKAFNLNDKYPAWNEDPTAPLNKDQIWNIFASLQKRMGFQMDSCKNMYDHFMMQLDSRTSRFPAHQALKSLHSDYIGGPNANYRKWYFAAHLDLDERVGLDSELLRSSSDSAERLTESQIRSLTEPTEKVRLAGAVYRWNTKMAAYNSETLVSQVALYLLIWGEANQVRFVPECLCFIYKCASDYIFTDDAEDGKINPDLPEYDFLNRVITPIYNFIRDQQFEKINGQYYRRERDHHSIIGYDDINQLFWYPEGIKKLITIDAVKLLDIDKTKRYEKLGRIAWDKVCYKTYYETRSWLHLVTNFSRIWVIHLSMFWYVTCFNSQSVFTPNYQQRLDNSPTPQSIWSLTALAGSIACVIYLIAVFGELSFIPKTWPGRERCSHKIFLGALTLLLNLAPSVYVFWFIPLGVYSKSAHIVSIVQFFVSIVTVAFLCCQPLGGLFGSYLKKSRRFVSSQTFTASFPKLSSKGNAYSMILWTSVFVFKFCESYFFLTLSLKDPVRNLSHMVMDRCAGDVLIGRFLCREQARFTLILIYFTDLVLYFLDTYLWYIICNCVFSVFLSFSSGISIFSPWRNIFQRLPQRLKVKIVSHCVSDGRYKTKFIISQLWNALIINMFQEHILSKEHAAGLLYQQSISEIDGSTFIVEPTFFVNQDDGSTKLSTYFPSGSEAERRFSFFARSLSVSMPEPIPLESMPAFTVLIPHYNEKILLSLKDVIKEDRSSKISILEYLRQLNGYEWTNFVEDSKELGATELLEIGNFDSTKASTPVNTKDREAPASSTPMSLQKSAELSKRTSDIPYYYFGFKDSSPNKILRTRVWASLKSQTLFRTVAGFSNYFEAIKLLYRTENLDLFDTQYHSVDSSKILDYVAGRKVNMIISMQRYQHFSEEEYDALKVLLTKFPLIKIAMLEEVPSSTEDEDPTFYSCLLAKTESESISLPDQKAPNLSVIYRVRLSGNPIIGDGKSDNQNNSIIFYRGEYIQVIDANQDMYLEECLKIRSILAEFEEIDSRYTEHLYEPEYLYPDEDPVAVVGAREHIFTEALGSLGDVAAGKEKTFGTLFARTLAEIGGKLHYGHPDFLNAIFMTTRGGISKAQKGIHLNEDIYAGMTAICRGGRIKHSDYFQCGKGRDLGFGSILNFTSKIGGGMGEQMLSREYFYLGTQLPLHRFLSFYYAHPGFHLNNLFIVLSVQAFMMVLINLGALSHESIKCIYDHNLPFTDLQRPLGCYNLQPVLDWVTRFVVSICICFFISFAPLIVQEFTERGFSKGFKRFFYHFASLSPVFEVFVCQIYANSLKSDLTFGGAKYIATGRGMATSRLKFTDQYTAYSGASIYSGMRMMLVMIFASITIWQPALLWFWLTAVSLCCSPFIFNPHQFDRFEFFLDYRNFIRWLTRGNSKFHRESWIAFTRSSRLKFTGLKRKAWKDENRLQITHKAAFSNSLFTEICFPLLQAVCTFIAYMFINSQNGVKDPEKLQLIIRMLLMVFTPIIVNAALLLVLFILSCFVGPLMGICFKPIGNLFAALGHGLGLCVHVLVFQVICFLEGWNLSRSLAAFICCIFMQRVVFQIVKVCLLTRELSIDYANRAWWSGRWINRRAGTLTITQPFREFIVKTVELSLFAADFTIGHVIFLVLTPFVVMPYADRIHSSMLFWLRPSVQYKRGLITKRERVIRKRRLVRYCVLYFLVMTVFGFLVVVPILAGKLFPDLRASVPVEIRGLVQPKIQNNNDTGVNAPRSIATAGKPRLQQYKTHAY